MSLNHIPFLSLCMIIRLIEDLEIVIQLLLDLFLVGGILYQRFAEVVEHYDSGVD